MDKITPLHIRFALACYYSDDPRITLAGDWNSPAGKEIIKWLVDNKLVVKSNRYRSTKKLNNWVVRLLNVANEIPFEDVEKRGASKLHIRYDRKAVNKYQPFVIDERGNEIEITGLTSIEEVQYYPVQQAFEHTLTFINVVCEDVALKQMPAPFMEFKRGDFLQSVVEKECVVQFYEWADETKTAFHGHLLRDSGVAMLLVKDGWADNWNGAVFVKQPEAPFAEWVK